MEQPLIIIESPSACTALAFSQSKDDFIIAGFQDGSVRSYILPNHKVYRAIKPLGDEISSLKFDQRKSSNTPQNVEIKTQNLWIASGKQILLFNINCSNLISDKKDAIEVISPDMMPDDDNVLNQIATSEARLAYTCDSGEVGIYDFVLKTSSTMRTSHSNIANCISFIPHRPSEVVSGGFDHKLLHYDSGQRSTLGAYQFDGTSSSSTTSLSPPFVLSLSVSSSGSIAASTADGRIWVSREGSRSFRTEVKKKRRKWEGLSNKDPSLTRDFVIASGPVVAVEFITEALILTLTLSGSVKIQRLPSSFTSQSQGEPLSTVWEVSTRDIKKTNALAFIGRNSIEESSEAQYWIAVGGVGEKGKGYIEVWAIPSHVLQDHQGE